MSLLTVLLTFFSTVVADRSFSDLKVVTGRNFDFDVAVCRENFVVSLLDTGLDFDAVHLMLSADDAV